MMLTGAEILVEVLIEQGVKDIFGYPGGAALNIYDVLSKNTDRITHYLTADESGAAHAADGYARATGKTGVCLATSGPGATNLVTGIATAFLDSIPMVAITANVSTDLIGKDSFQEVFTTGITNPITKHNYAVRDITRLAHTVRTAFKIANSGRKGPVLIDIPKDISMQECEFVPQKPIEASKENFFCEEKLRVVADHINAAKKPVICFGGGIVSGNASEEMWEFIKKTGIPAAHTIMATGIIACGDKHDLGMTGMHGSLTANAAIENADLLIAAGTRLSDRVALKGKSFASNARLIQFDIDESEIDKSVESYMSVIGDIKDVLKNLIPLVEHKERLEWFEEIESFRDRDYVPPADESLLLPHKMMEIIGEIGGRDAVITTDVGQHQIWAAQYCKTVKPRGFITSGGLGTMGFGYGAAIGVKIALPEVKVFHITGDGSLHMNMAEAATAVSYRLPIITIIMDNTTLGMVKQLQHCFCEGRYFATEPARKTDYVGIIKAFGGNGYRVETPDEFRKALSEAMRSDLPSWIVCPVDSDALVFPMTAFGKGVEDILLG